jgi:putative tryptophan/tyrosine transport system substrate-binding protein
MSRRRSRCVTRRGLLRHTAAGLALAGCLPLLSCQRRASSSTPTARVYRIGFLSSGSDARGTGVVADWIPAALAALGYVEGRNLTIEWRFSEGVSDRTATDAAQLVQLPVDLIVAPAGLAIEAAMQATKRIPIIMAPGTDPVESGYVTSLAHPGSNVTGFAALQRALVVKRLELLKQVLPTVSRLDVFTNAGRLSLVQAQAAEAEAAALGIEVRRLVASTPSEFDSVFAATASDAADAIYVVNSPIANTNKDRVLAWAAVRHAPLIGDSRDWALSGALLTYGWSAQEMAERVAVTIDRILKGASPAEIPVEQSTRFDLAINLRTAQTLNLTLPPALIAKATEVIR